MNRTEIRSKLEETLVPILSVLDYELVFVDYLKQNKKWIVRIYIDKPGGGISLNDCEKASKAIDTKLDEANIIDMAYLLEVCSPGLDRPLIKDNDFIKFQGKKIKVKTKEPIGSRKIFIGILKQFKEGTLTIETELKKEFLIPKDIIQKANLVIEI
jgi:ribosome maturation factor RimP